MCTVLPPLPKGRIFSFLLNSKVYLMIPALIAYFLYQITYLQVVLFSNCNAMDMSIASFYVEANIQLTITSSPGASVFEMIKL